MKNTFLIFYLAFVIVTSCEKDSEPKSNDIEITFGTICGECSGGDSLVIIKDKICYEYFTPCGNNDYSKDSTISAKDWDELLALVDMEKFKIININTCNYCVDGCDTWLRIKNGDDFHQIRFGYQDSTIVKDIKPLIDKLALISSGFRK